MKKMGLCLFLVSAFQVGCNSAVTDFVSEVRSPASPTSPTPTPSLAVSSFVRISQGHVRSSAGGQSAEMTVGPAIRRAQAGADMSASMRLSSNRLRAQ